MKLLIGTIYSGENEIDECLKSIRAQRYTNYDHILIENLPKREAHHRLYKTFLEHAQEYKLLVKVDADTVLCSDELFGRLVETFEQDPMLEVMNIGVLDFFTDEMIPAGIQIYRNTTRWDFEKDTIFTDVPIMDHERYRYDTTVLAPAAWHSPNPSIPQAFHYGVHRGLKSIQRIHSTFHWANIQKVWRHFLKTQDVRLGFAVMGAELVYAGTFNRKDQDYTNPRLGEVLRTYEGMNAKQVKREIRRLRFLHWGFLPDDLRRKVIRYKRGKLDKNWDQL
jgi:glycosyltransferase involved in cell wall biosynthesis